MLNDCHRGACGGHLSGLSTAQKILRVDELTTMDDVEQGEKKAGIIWRFYLLSYPQKVKYRKRYTSD